MGIVRAISSLFRRRPRVSKADIEHVIAMHRDRVAARQAAWQHEEDNFRQLVGSLAGAGAWPRFAGLMGRPVSLGMMRSGDHRLAAKYDAAQTTTDNINHWAMADALSADAANNASIRKILRNRARYEVANNCYAAGVGLTIANDCIGTGPRLNIDSERSGSISEAMADEVERKFSEWCRAVNLASLLRIMRTARRQDGESFALFVSNPGIEHEVKLGLKLIEADCVSSFDLAISDRRIDGIRFDEYGNPTAYDILRQHPGSDAFMGSMQYDVWPRDLVLHWFRSSRAQQHRGIPEMLAALPLYATLRRYTQATLDAAEAAADMAVLLQTQADAEFTNADGSEANPEAAEAFSTVPFERRMFVAVPQGYEAKQFEAKQPTQMYSDFKREIAGEIGRCENVSRNVVLLDSSESNFASGQLDHRTTYRAHDIDRDDGGIVVLDRIFRAWLNEASLISDYLPQAMRMRGSLPPHSWYWDSNELGDPLKLAKAKAEELRCGLTSLPKLYAQKGQDWNRELRLAARGYGITPEELAALIVKAIFDVQQPAESGASSSDDEEPAQPPKSGAGRVKQGAAA